MSYNLLIMDRWNQLQRQVTIKWFDKWAGALSFLAKYCVGSNIFSTIKGSNTIQYPPLLSLPVPNIWENVPCFYSEIHSRL